MAPPKNRLCTAFLAFAALLVGACAEGQPAGSLIDNDTGGFDPGSEPSPGDPDDTGGTPLPGPDPDGPPDDGPPDDGPPDAGPPDDGPPDAGPEPPTEPEPEPDAAPAPEPEPDAGPDPGPVCPTEPCDILTQCGCEEPLACDLDETNLPANACREVTVAGRENATCETLSDCDAGYVCVSSTCRRYCSSGDQCDSPRGQCIISLSADTGEPIPGLRTCSSNCDPSASVHPECPANFGCRLRQLGNGTEYARCETTGGLGDGAACSASSECGVGLQCVSGACLEICSSGDTSCPVGRECFGFSPSFFIGAVEYGYCF